MIDQKELYKSAVLNYADALYRFAYKSTQEIVLAQEATFGSFQHLRLNISECTNEAMAKLYTFRKAYHLMLNDIRIKPGLMVHSGLRPDLPECSVVSDEECQDLLLKRLTQTEKYILILSKVETFSNHEISYITDLSETQIEDLLMKIEVKSKQIFIGEGIMFKLSTIEFPFKDLLLEEKKEVDWMRWMPAFEFSLAAACILFLFVPFIRGEMNTGIPNTPVSETIEVNKPKPKTLKLNAQASSNAANVLIPLDSSLSQTSLKTDTTKLVIENQIQEDHPRKIKKEKIFKQAIEEIQPLKEADMLLQETPNMPAKINQEQSKTREKPESKEDKNILRSLFKRKKKNQEEPIVQAEEEY